MDARDADEVAVVADTDVAARLQHPGLEPRAGIGPVVEAENLDDVVRPERHHLHLGTPDEHRGVDETELEMLDGRRGRDEPGCEDPDEPGGEVRVDDRGEGIVDASQELRHAVLGWLREREQHRWVGLVVEQCELLDPRTFLPPEPARVRPEEVVQVAEGIRMNRRTPAAELGDDVPIADSTTPMGRA